MVNRFGHLHSANGAVARKKKEVKRTQLGTTIPEELLDAVRDYSELTGIPIARITEDALRDYLNSKKAGAN